MRTFLQIFISLIVLALGYLGMTNLTALGDKERPKPQKVIKTVFVDTVQIAR